MKKIFLVVMALLMVMMSLSVNAQRRLSETADVRADLLNQEPDPAEPGDYVDVRFQLQNNGSQAAQNLVFEVLPEYPFSLDPGRSSTETIGSLYYSQSGGETKVVKFRLRVDPNALDGEHDLKVRYKFNGNGWIEPEPFSISVRTQEPVISIDSVNIGKDTLEPGIPGVIKIKVTNTADSFLKDIRANLNLGSSFVSMGSTNEKSISDLGPKESYEFNFNVITNPETKSGVYQLPLRLSYSNSVGNDFTRNGSIGVVVNSKPDLSITLDETTIFESGKKGDIVIKVVNKGVTDLKFMNVKVVSGEGYTVLSNKEDYLGNIDSDDFETADFTLFVEKSDQKQLKLPLTLEYKDANNNQYKDNVALNIDLFSSSDAKRLGLVESGGSFGWIVIIIVLVAGFFIYRRYKKRKK